MQFTSVGYFSKTHGLKGHLVLFSQADFDFESVDAIFIEANGSQAPYFIEEIKPFNDGLLVKLEEVSSVEAAAKLKNKTVLVDSKFIFEEEAFEFLNYKLIDKQKGEIGIIEEFINDTGNPLIKIMREGKDNLLPFNEDLIEKIKKKEKQIIYTAPEGLLDLYL
jgi:16S rRNA processing protein RimM